jgi:quercetin dioxygenase-like cupin family protein
MVGIGSEIVNPRTGQRMRFLPSDGSVLQIETVNPPGPAEPEHIHPHQQSSANVLAGTLHFSVRGRVQVVHAGERIVIPPNTPHYFWNASEDEARALQEFRPALRTEEFFRTYFGLAGDGKLDEHGMPSLLQVAVMVPAFADVMRPTRPPWPVLRALTLLLGPIARMRGYRATYPPYSGDAAADRRTGAGDQAGHTRAV